MNKFIAIGGCVIFSLVYFKLSIAQCTNNYCPPTNPENYTASICEPFIDSLFAVQSACLENVFGGALIRTQKGEDVVQRDNNPDNVCPYFQESTVVNDCLHPNGTVEAYTCTSLFTLAILLKDICDEYYTINFDNFTTLGQLQYNYSQNPCNNCRPAIGPEFCELNPNPSAPPPCPNCASTTLAPTSTETMMPSSAPICD